MGSDQTRRRIELVISRIIKGRPKIVQPTPKLSIAPVAVESGISNSTIYNRYPNLAELIRKKINNDSRERLAQKAKVLQGTEQMLKDPRAVLTRRDSDLK